MALQQVRFLHTSDWHLEQPVGGVAQVPTALRDPFIDAPFTAAERVVQAALDHHVDFVVLAGNILPIETASPYTFEFLFRQFHRLSEEQIAVYWLGGEIDDLDLWPAQLDLPSNVHTFPVGTIQQYEHKRDRKRVAQLIGQSWQRGGSWRASDFLSTDESVPQIAVAFGPLQKRSLENKGIEYWALGGEKRHRVLNYGKSTAAYAGSPQGRAPTDTDAHGAVLCEIEFSQTKTRLIETDLFRWRREKVQAAEVTDTEELQAELSRQMNQLSGTSTRYNDLMVWSIVCGGALAQQLALPKIRDRLIRNLHQSSTPDSRWTMVLETEPAEVTHDLAEEDSILGDFLRTVNRYEQDTNRWDELLAFVPDGEIRATLTSRFQACSAEEQRLMWRRVASWGADLLRGEVELEPQETTRRKDSPRHPSLTSS